MQDAGLLKCLKPRRFPPLALSQHVGKFQKRISQETLLRSTERLNGTPEMSREKTRMMKTTMRVQKRPSNRISSL